MLTPGPRRTSFFLYLASSPRLPPYSLDKSGLKVAAKHVKAGKAVT